MCAFNLVVVLGAIKKEKKKLIKMQPTPITVPSDANAFPPELLEAPQPVIGFVGLDCYRNLTHKSIWDAFNTNRKSDR